MTTTYPATSAIRSTIIKLFTEKCPAAVDLYDEGDEDRSLYAAGTAAHDIAHAIGIYPDADPDNVAAIIIAKLMATGRSGYDAEGPLSPDSVVQGRDIFMHWLYNGGDVHPHPAAQYEVGMGFIEGEDGTWESAEYGSHGVSFQIRPDVVYPIQIHDEGGSGVGLVTRDYKTAWPTSQSTCETIQLKAQALAVWLSRKKFMTMEPDFIRREVVNLRTRTTYHSDTWMDQSGRDKMEVWKSDIMATVKAIHSGDRAPRVGKHCLSCPYVLRCEARKATAAVDDPKALAASYVMGVAAHKAMHAQLKAATEEHPIKLERSFVGFSGKESRTPKDDVAKLVWDKWTEKMDLDSAATSAARGCLMSLKLGMTQLKAIAKALFPEKDQKAEREIWVWSVTDPVVKRSFNVWPLGDVGK